MLQPGNFYEALFFYALFPLLRIPPGLLLGSLACFNLSLLPEVIFCFPAALLLCNPFQSGLCFPAGLFLGRLACFNLRLFPEAFF
jgi:hypothetical protein